MNDPMPAAGGDLIGLFQPTRHVRAFEEVMNQIRALLADGRLTVGDKLPPEREFAARMSVSRHSVREALRMLEISGVITLRRGPRGGAFIIDPEGERSLGLLGRSLRFTDVSVADITQAMRAITMLLLDTAMPVIDESGFAALDANIAEAEGILDPAARSAVIIRFYHVLATITGNPILIDLADSLCEILLDWVIKLGSLGGPRVLASRRSIVDRLRTGDPESAKREFDAYLVELHAKWMAGDRS